MTDTLKITEFNNAVDQIEADKQTLNNAVNSNGTVTIGGVDRDTLPTILSNAETSKNSIVAQETQVNNLINDAKGTIFDAYNTNPSETVNNVVKTTAQACYDAINNAPIGAHVEFVAQGDFDLLTSQFNHIRGKHIFIRLKGGARIVFDQTLILLGTHFRIQSWVDATHYLQANVTPMFKGYGCVGFFDYFGGQIRTNLPYLTIAQEANGGDLYGSDGALFVRYRNVSFKRNDGSDIDATTAPLSVLGKNINAQRYGANFGGAPQTNTLYLNGATYTNM